MCVCVVKCSDLLSNKSIAIPVDQKQGHNSEQTSNGDGPNGIVHSAAGGPKAAAAKTSATAALSSTSTATAEGSQPWRTPSCR